MICYIIFVLSLQKGHKTKDRILMLCPTKASSALLSWINKWIKCRSKDASVLYELGKHVWHTDLLLCPSSSSRLLARELDEMHSAECLNRHSALPLSVIPDSLIKMDVKCSSNSFKCSGNKLILFGLLMEPISLPALSAICGYRRATATQSTTSLTSTIWIRWEKIYRDERADIRKSWNRKQHVKKPNKNPNVTK